MLKIRLQRTGRKNIPTFRVVLTDSKNSTKSGKFLEILGFYDPVNNQKEFKKDRIKGLIANGAQLSKTMHNFMIDEKVIEGKKINVLPRKSPIVKKEEKGAEKTEGKKKETVAEAPAGEKAEKKEEKPAKAEVKAEVKPEEPVK